MRGLRPQQAAERAQEAAGATNAPSVDAGATTPEIGTHGFGPTIAPCGCDLAVGADDELDRLREMVAGGIGQWGASRAIWGRARE